MSSETEPVDTTAAPADDDDALLKKQKAAGRTCVGQHRVWMGNIDPRVSEYRLTKLLRRCGELSGFDNLLFRDGPMAGRPRGYAFASFATRQDAEQAVRRLDGLLVGEKQLRLRWALDNERAPTRTAGASSQEEPPPEVIQDMAATPDAEFSSTDAKIRAIEAALMRSEAAAASDTTTRLGTCSSSRGGHSGGLGAVMDALPRVRATVDTINNNRRRHVAPPVKTRPRYRPRPAYKPRYRR